MFSKRLSWSERANALSVLLARKRDSGTVVLDLTESNSTQVGLSYPDGILSALANPAAMVYEPAPLGRPEARAGVVDYYARRGILADPKRLMLTASTSEAYGFLFKLLCDPGDEILTPRPSYPLFEFLAGLESVTVRQYPLRYDGAWHIDFPALEDLLTPRTRAIVVVNPNNPTGSFLKLSELRQLEELAASRGLAILSDEVFSDYALEDDPKRVTSLIGSRKALTFSMSGLSKVAGLPQMKLGWIAVSGPHGGDALERLELIADTYLSVGSPIQTALPEVLSLGEGVQQQIRARTAVNVGALRVALRNTSVSLLNTEGGWCSVMHVPRTRSEEEWVLVLLRDHDVLMQPGFFFDFESEAYLVVSLLTDPAQFEQGIARFTNLL